MGRHALPEDLVRFMRNQRRRAARVAAELAEAAATKERRRLMRDDAAYEVVRTQRGMFVRTVRQPGRRTLAEMDGDE